MKTKETLKQEADARQAVARDPKAQLAHLDKLGLTAKKERAKLQKRIATAQEAAAKPPKAKK